MRELSTKRLTLRPATRSDLDALHGLWLEPLVRRFLWDDLAISRDEAGEMLDQALAQGARGLGLWTLWPREPATPQLMGCAGLLPVSAAASFEPRLAGTVEPLLALKPGLWHRGYAREALAELLHYAATDLGLSELSAVTDVPNDASDRMLRHAGFVPFGECAGAKYRLRTYLAHLAQGG